MNLTRTLRLLLLASGFGCSLTAWAVDSNIGDTSSTSHEIQFCSGSSSPYTSCAAADLRLKADALGSAPAIYEYVRNNYDYALYHGARSGAINTYLGGRGNDVDLAATLISMLRSRGTPARYVVGTVSLPVAQVKNWLAVENTDLAHYLLRDMGIQSVALDANKTILNFEHVWVEALVPYAKYRGAGTSTIDCNATPSSCNWVPLDPSFKQRKQRASGIDPNAVQYFDFTTYYSALKNSDAKSVSMRDKNPLEIYQEQTLSWLQTNAPGKTLEDIPDFTTIVAEENGLLPASLPFVTTGNLRRYNSAADHDAAVPGVEAKKWMKYVTAEVKMGTTVLGSATASLVDVATKSFTLVFTPDGSNYLPVFRVGGVQTGTVSTQATPLGTNFSLVVSMDGAPAADTTYTDETISASYDNSVVGGYFLIAASGENANWSQVHRASQQLLTANQQYKIVFNPTDPGITGHPCDVTTGLYCAPYVDANNNGWDAADSKLLDSGAALDALTGGMLFVAGNQYYAAYRDAISKLDAINKVKTPISGFLGVISTTHDVEYIDGTAFSVVPGGLLIDMRGIHFTGAWRIDQPAIFDNGHADLIGHIGSSLEHEIWQKLTGYDAISTVRGIQLALANSATLVNVQKSASTDTISAMYTSFGYSTTAPAGFTRNVRNIFGQDYLTWGYGGADTAASFVAFRANVQGMATTDPLLWSWSYAANNGIDGYLSAIDQDESNLNALKATEGQLKTNVTQPVQSSTFSTYNVLSAEIAGSSTAGFSLASYSKTASDTYSFTFNETSNHTDGTHLVTVNVDLGDATNEKQAVFYAFPSGTPLFSSLSGPTLLTGMQSATVTSPTGFAINSPYTGLASGNGPLYLGIKETAPHTDGTYNVAVSVVLGISIGTTTANYTIPVTIKSGRWVDATAIPIQFNIDVSDSTRLDCYSGDTLNTYTGTPTALLGNLQSCFNTTIQLNNLASQFTFFDPSATLEFRSITAGDTTSDTQLTSEVIKIRNDLYANDQSKGWLEYLVPSKLSVGPNYRFVVDIRNFYEVGTNILRSGTYGIENKAGISAGGGFVSPLQSLTSPLVPVLETK